VEKIWARDTLSWHGFYSPVMTDGVAPVEYLTAGAAPVVSLIAGVALTVVPGFAQT
jgi:hypothetical protein